MSQYRLTVRSAAGKEQQFRVAAGTSIRDALDATELRVRAACGGTGACGACLVRLLAGDCNPPTLAEYQKLLPEERAAGVRLACQLRPRGDTLILLDHPAPPSRWKSIAADTLYNPANGLANLRDRIYGVAVDLGTTHIRVSLWDRRQPRRIASRVGPNPQNVFGADVLNRLQAAQGNPHRAGELAKLARAAIIQALRDMLARDVGEVTPMLAEIGQLLIVGNSAMLALLSGQGGDALLNPDNWQRAIDCEPRDAASWRQQWYLPNAQILLAPPAAGFVGSDLLADLVACDLCGGPAGSLLLDIGTNTEIALWDGNQLLLSSVPGGPAFEGVGIRNGMAAEPGAIYRVGLAPGSRPDRLQLSCASIDDATPCGICGSGLLDAVALLLQQGLLRPSGRFRQSPGADGYRLLADNPKSAVSGGDVDALQRAKAATSAAMAELLAEAGMHWSDISRLCICGAFGHHLDIAHAQAIGLLPELPATRYELFANASLAGCERALLTAEGSALFRNLTRQIRTINLSLRQGYDDRYIDHLRLRPVPAVT
jgi:uncharacterized 2Fe-2S/4Fe-4S cluster protein (DUF4445 family)